jgi:hypothetical protein
MMIDIISVRSLGGFKLEIEFSDGSVGVRDFQFVANKTGSMAEPLKDPAYFTRVFIEDGALTWPNGYDWDPIALHDEMRQAGLLRRVETADAFPPIVEGHPRKSTAANVYIEARPKGRPRGSPIDDYVVEDGADNVLKTFKTQKEAIDWAKKQGHHPLVARVRHLNDKKMPDHWRAATQASHRARHRSHAERSQRSFR